MNSDVEMVVRVLDTPLYDWTVALVTSDVEVVVCGLVVGCCGPPGQWPALFPIQSCEALLLPKWFSGWQDTGGGGGGSYTGLHHHHLADWPGGDPLL